MKRLFFLIAALTLLLCGCQEGETPSGSQPENAYTVLGRVTQVSGNDFVLALGSYPSPAAGREGGAAPEGQGAGASSGGESSGSRSGRSSRSEDASGEGGMPSGLPEDFPAGMAEGGPGGEAPAENAPAGGASGKPSGQSSGRSFTESGEELSIRIPVGTPITYGTLKVDFSQIQADYVVQLTVVPTDSGSPLVLSGEILST